MNKLRNFIFVSSIFSALVLFIFGIYLLNSINGGKKSDNNSTFSQMLNLDAYKPLKDPINIMLVGADVAIKKDDAVRTDTIMVVNYNPKNSQVNILSIPRDTRIVYKRKQEKINAVYEDGGADDRGCKALQEVISNLLGVHLDYYVLVKTDVFRAVIDELGGIEYDVPCDLHYVDSGQNLNINIKKGLQTLDGTGAEGVMRFRHPQRRLYSSYESFKEVSKYYNGSDLNRIDAQQKFIKEIVKQKASLSTLSKVQEIVGIVFNKLITDLKLKTTIQIGSNIGELSTDKINNFKISVIDVGNDVAYTKKIMDNETKKEYPGEDIINKYFNTGDDWVPTETAEIETDDISTPIKKTIAPTIRRTITANPFTVKPVKTQEPVATTEQHHWTIPPKTTKPTIAPQTSTPQQTQEQTPPPPTASN